MFTQYLSPPRCINDASEFNAGNSHGIDKDPTQGGGGGGVKILLAG